MANTRRRDAHVLMAWLATRIVVFGAAILGVWQAGGGAAGQSVGWNQWDTKWFVSIAEFGYVGPNTGPFTDFTYNVAFFPGLPMLIRVGIGMGVDPVVTGLAVSLLASLAASLGMARLAERMDANGSVTVWVWLAAPTALFLAAAYTEALFAAFAIWAWLMAREGRWLAAGLLASGAALSRPNGLFLAVGLAVLAIATLPRRQLMRAWPVGIPVLVTGLHFSYLRAVTGSWTAWSDAQRDYWGRELVAPWTALRNTYDLIFTFSPTGEPSSRMVTEIIAMAILVAGVVVLLRRRWWGEAAYVGMTAISLGTSTMYHSVPRTLVIMFPLWILLGAWLGRHRGWLMVYSLVSLPFLALVTARFVQGQWIS